VRYFEWNSEKNEQLKKERRISFEQIVIQIEGGKLLDVLDHPQRGKYGNQRLFVVEQDDYVYLVPFIEDAERIFLKTIIPSRKATKKYLRK
jgi:uncharacterized DUF497 family protein